MTTKGQHIIADLWDCLACSNLQELVLSAARAAGAEIVGVCTHSFQPEGETVAVLLADSHLTVHTYPEARFVAVDIYTCGTEADPQRALDAICETLQPRRREVRHVTRGVA